MDSIIYLVKYHKYWLDKDDGVVNPDFDLNSRLILALKKRAHTKFNEAVDYYYALLKEEIIKHLLDEKEKIYVAIVPSSNRGEYSYGIGLIVKRLRNDYNIVNSKNPLYRKTNIRKLAHGGSRNISVHLNSISITSKHVSRGAKTILLDDVTTSGGSILACKQLLESAGAGKIISIALAKTT